MDFRIQFHFIPFHAPQIYVLLRLHSGRLIYEEGRENKPLGIFPMPSVYCFTNHYSSLDSQYMSKEITHSQKYELKSGIQFFKNKEGVYPNIPLGTLLATYVKSFVELINSSNVTLTILDIVDMSHLHWTRAQQMKVVVSNPHGMINSTANIVHMSPSHGMQHDSSCIILYNT